MQSKLKENIFSLFVLQGANYVLPLITLPYLLRVLGPEKFGLIAFSQAFIQYFVLATDYGFNLSATRQVAIHRADSAKVSEIFSTVLLIKLMLSLVSFGVLCLIILLIPRFNQDAQIYFASFLIVIGNALFPIWFFQGLEKMRLITISNIAAKFLATFSIFALVHSRQDFVTAALLQASGFLISGIIGLVLSLRLVKLSFKLPKMSGVSSAFKDGWHVFLSTAAVSLYTISNTFILGLITNNTLVGYFSAAEKIVRAVQGMLSPITQALYPHINSFAQQSKQMATDLIKKSLTVLGGISLFLSTILLFFAHPIVSIVFGAQYLPVVPIIRWMAFLPFVITLSNIFGVQTMLTFGMKKQFSRILVGSGLLNLILIFPLGYKFGAIGSAISVFITEIVVTIVMGLTIKNTKIFVFSSKECAV